MLVSFQIFFKLIQCQALPTIVGAHHWVIRVQKTHCLRVINFLRLTHILKSQSLLNSKLKPYVHQPPLVGSPLMTQNLRHDFRVLALADRVFLRVLGFGRFQYHSFRTNAPFLSGVICHWSSPHLSKSTWEVRTTCPPSLKGWPHNQLVWALDPTPYPTQLVLSTF